MPTVNLPLLGKWIYMENGTNETPTVESIVAQHISANTKQEDGAGANKDDTKQIDAPAEEKKSGDAPADTSTDKLNALLAELNIDSVETLKSRLSKEETKELTPEQREKLEQEYEAELIGYGVKSGDMKVEDFDTVKSLRKTADQELVFNNWKVDFKEENPEIEEADFDLAAKEAFETEFKINSQNEKTKQRGEERLKKEAQELRNPYETKYQGIKSKFDQEREIKKEYPSFDKKITGYASENIPDKYEVFKDKDGDEDVLVALDLSADEKKEIADEVKKQLNTDYVFGLHKEGKHEEIEKIAKKLTENLLWDKKREVGLKELANTFLVRGKAKGQVGATNSFAANELLGNKNQKVNNTGQTAADEVLASLSGTKEN